MITVYLAGPMSGHPQFNFPLFDAVADRLRKLGYNIQSPAELDRPETRAAALASHDGSPDSGTTNGETWGDFLARDVKLIADGVDAVAVMPEWWTSRGARLEAFVATLCDKPVYDAQHLLDLGPNPPYPATLAPQAIYVAAAGLRPQGSCHLPLDVFKDAYDPHWRERAAGLREDSLVGALV